MVDRTLLLRVALLATLASALAPAPARATWHALESIPVESPIYRMIEDLSASYGFGTAFLATQPWDRADLGHFLDELVVNTPAAAGDPLVMRLRRELEPAGGPGGWDALVTAGSDEGEIELSPYALTNYSEDRARSTVVRDLRAGLQASAALGDNLLLWADLYAGTSSTGAHGNPVDTYHDALFGGSQVNPYFDRAYGTWRGRRGRVQVGHTWLRWGPGAWGTMTLSDGSPAYDVAEARVPLLRSLQLEWFVATLDPLDESYLAGHKLEWRPSARWDLSLGELARFQGTASVPIYLIPVIPYSSAGQRTSEASRAETDTIPAAARNNVMWCVDVAWRWRPGMRFYGELAVDDASLTSGDRPLAIAWQAGGEIRRLRGKNAWTLRGEYARVYQYTYSSYDGKNFAFAGYPTAFPLGTDVERTNGRVEWQQGPAWRIGVEGSYVRKGESEIGDAYVPGEPFENHLILSGTIETDSRVAASVDWSPAPGLVLGVTGGKASITAPDHVAGASADGAYVVTRGTFRW